MHITHIAIFFFFYIKAKIVTAVLHRIMANATIYDLDFVHET